MTLPAKDSRFIRTGDGLPVKAAAGPFPFLSR